MVGVKTHRFLETELLHVGGVINQTAGHLLAVEQPLAEVVICFSVDEQTVKLTVRTRGKALLIAALLDIASKSAICRKTGCQANFTLSTRD
jgi:hypothetical protein